STRLHRLMSRSPPVSPEGSASPNELVVGLRSDPAGHLSLVASWQLWRMSPRDLGGVGSCHLLCWRFSVGGSCAGSRLSVPARRASRAGRTVRIPGRAALG